MLKTLTNKNHSQLIELLCTYKFRGQYHLMFPYAEANLREYWEKTDRDLSRDTCGWVMDQMRGLASALNAIHNNPLSPADTLSQHEDRRSKTQSAEKYGRHGDLKPENILWFSEPSPHGSLVITDLGLGNFHSQHSRSNLAAGNIGGSVTYAPSELALNTRVSRTFDIWSLGCVYMEFIVWLLQGWEGLQAFANERLSVGFDGVEDDSFFRIFLDSKTDKPEADIRPVVRERFFILHKDPKCPPAIHDLLTLIESKMLVIQPQSRIQSSALLAKLEAICLAYTGNNKNILI